MNKAKKNFMGILFCFGIAVAAWFLGKALPIIGGPVFGILLGMILIAIFPKIRTIHVSKKSDVGFLDGIAYTSKKVLQYSIILLGFEMNLFNIISVGSQSLFVILFTLTSAFLVAFFLGRALKVEGKLATLIGVGTSICGGSAIAATAPVIRASDEDIAASISTIFLFNIIAVFIFPALGHLLGMSDVGFGMWAGTAINDTSSVVAAGASWSATAGNNAALEFATIVKLTRTLMIVPITLFLAILTSRKSKLKSKTDGSRFSFLKVFPWFVIGFLLAAVLTTFLHIPASVTHILSTIGHFMIVMAMVAIGLNTNFKKLVSNGFKPIFLGLMCWFAVAVVSLIVQHGMGIW
ncbi:MAG: YeiH family protein [Christensenellaceae bacterium]